MLWTLPTLAGVELSSIPQNVWSSYATRLTGCWVHAGPAGAAGEEREGQGQGQGEGEESQVRGGAWSGDGSVRPVRVDQGGGHVGQAPGVHAVVLGGTITGGRGWAGSDVWRASDVRW